MGTALADLHCKGKEKRPGLNLTAATEAVTGQNAVEKHHKTPSR